MCQKNILLIGKNGQLGKAFIKYADLLDSNFYKFFFIGRDLLDLENSEEAIYDRVINNFDPDLIINTAAFTKVDKAEIFKEISLKVNGESLKLISKQCKKREIPLIHFSTDYVFNGLGFKPWKINHPTNPVNYYGETKLIGENYIKRSSINFVIFRVSWVFGHQGENFVNTMLNLSKKEELKIVNDQFGGPTSAEYIAKKVIKLVPYILKNNSPLNNSKKLFPWGIYHLQGWPIVSWFEFANKIFEKAIELNLLNTSPRLLKTKTKDYKTVAHRPLNSILDCTETRFDLGINQPLWENDLDEYLINFLSKR